MTKMNEPTQLDNLRATKEGRARLRELAHRFLGDVSVEHDTGFSFMDSRRRTREIVRCRIGVVRSLLQRGIGTMDIAWLLGFDHSAIVRMPNSKAWKELCGNDTRSHGDGNGRTEQPGAGRETA